MNHDSPARRLARALRTLRHRVAFADRADVVCCGMTAAQAATIELLAASGPLRLGELGDRLGVAPSTLTRNLARLEEIGWVRRAPDSEDGRATTAELTSAGDDALAEVVRGEEALAERVLAELGGAREAEVVSTVEDLVAAFERALAECCGGSCGSTINRCGQ